MIPGFGAPRYACAQTAPYALPKSNSTIILQELGQDICHSDAGTILHPIGERSSALSRASEKQANIPISAWNQHNFCLDREEEERSGCRKTDSAQDAGRTLLSMPCELPAGPEPLVSHERIHPVTPCPGMRHDLRRKERCRSSGAGAHTSGDAMSVARRRAARFGLHKRRCDIFGYFVASCATLHGWFPSSCCGTYSGRYWRCRVIRIWRATGGERDWPSRSSSRSRWLTFCSRIL